MTTWLELESGGRVRTDQIAIWEVIGIPPDNLPPDFHPRVEPVRLQTNLEAFHGNGAMDGLLFVPTIMIQGTRILLTRASAV